MLICLQMIDTPEQRTKLEYLYDKYRNLMFCAARKILNDNSDAEDAVQQAFVKIAENMERIQDPDCPKTRCLLVTIVENKAIDQYRRKQKIHKVEYIEENIGLSAEYHGEDVLTKCILKLPGRYREIISLKYHQGYSTKEAAKIMGISESNASKLDQRAKKKLKEFCRKEGIL